MYNRLMETYWKKGFTVTVINHSVSPVFTVHVFT